MALKTIDQNPTITDTILFEITTPDANGCFLSNPYKVDSVIIFYVERDFLGTNFGSYDTVTTNPTLLVALQAAKNAVCVDPSLDNISNFSQIQSEIESRSQTSTFYYRDSTAVQVVGSEGFPAWLSTDTTDSLLILQPTDAQGNPQFGHFTYEWTPNGSVREGDFFICWTWTPLPAGNKLSANIQFVIEGDPNAVSSIPTHITAPGKYATLLERYLPDMYKLTLSSNDETPQVLDTFNQAVAQGFTFLEDLANQIIDLFDANALHESLLVFLSNLFNLKLRSSDPTLWRRQIKEAIPLFKMKGTLPGLKMAFAQAGMELQSFTQFWQMVSPYTWVESFLVKNSATFTLVKSSVILPVNNTNFSLWIKRGGGNVSVPTLQQQTNVTITSTYQQISLDNVIFEVGDDCTSTMTWVGDEKSAGAIQLYEGDYLKVMYQYRPIPDNTAQQLENYIRSLPLADQRDDTELILNSSTSYLQEIIPLKNWNVRLISEDDPLFTILIPVRHPFQDPLIFGYLRTEFAYSENIYNMEEYNGSIRPSNNPCDIDKNFIDPCGSCLSSIYSVDIGVEELSNDRMLEAQDILREYTPFHAQVHSLNFVGEVHEFVMPPVENIDFLVSLDFSQFVLSGESNPIFTRDMPGGLSYAQVNRQQLTDELTVLTGQTGQAYNDHVSFVTPDYNLGSFGISNEFNLLEILAPSGNAGSYKIEEIKGNMARLASDVIEPVDESAFTFNLSNVLYGTSTATITQSDQFAFTDVNEDFNLLGVKTLWDVEHTPDYTGGTWTVLIPTYSATPYEINDVIEGVLYLKDNGSLPTTVVSGLTYTLLDGFSNAIASSHTGSLAITLRGYVNLNDTGIVNIHDFIILEDYLVYNGTEYPVIEFDGKNFWIGNYSAGTVSGVNVQTRRRIINNGIGYFGYFGLKLITQTNIESDFGIINGDNPPPANQQKDNSLFKENFMFLINGDFYKISEIDGKNVILSGRNQDWTTLDAGGTIVSYNLVHFPTKEVNIGFIVFDHLDRNGKDPVIREIESTVTQNVAIVALSTPSGTAIQESTSQEEGISFTIEKRNGDILEGEI